MHSPQDSQKARSRGTTFAKRALVGNTAGRVPPSWKSSTQDRLTKQKPINENTGEVVTRRNASHFPRVGSKILMGQLPADSVSERDIEELFAETVGPVFNVFIVYNSQGRSKGMAVVHFQRAGDALEARRMYNGRPLKIELIIDPPEFNIPQAPIKSTAPLPVKSLAERLAAAAPTKAPTKPVQPATGRRQQTHRRLRKKGPARLKKSAEQLDKDMVAYMAQARKEREATGINTI